MTAGDEFYDDDVTSGLTPHDRLALATFGRTRADAHLHWECVRCSKSVNSMSLQDVDWKEYRITALCPKCFEELTPEVSE